MANISDILMQQAETSSKSKGIADEQGKLGTAYTELADIVGQTKTAVEADDARATKLASEQRYKLADSYDSNPSNANNILNTLGQSIANNVKVVKGTRDAMDAIANESFLDDPLKKLADVFLIRPGLYSKNYEAKNNIEEDLKLSQAVNLAQQQGYQTYAALGSAISDEQLKNKLEYIGAKAGQEAMSAKFTGLAWQSSALELVDKSTSSELKGLEAYFNQGQAEQLFKFNQDKFANEQDYQAKTLDNAAKNLELSTETVNRQNAQFDRVLEQDTIKANSEARAAESLRLAATKLGLNLNLASPVIPLNATPEEIATLTRVANAQVVSDIKEMKKNPNLKLRLEALEAVADSYTGQSLAGVPEKLFVNVWGTNPWGAYNTVNALGGLPATTLPQERDLNAFYRENYTDLSTKQIGLLHSTSDRLTNSSSKTGKVGDITGIAGKETVAGSESTSVNSKYITPINAQNSAAENGAVFDEDIISKAIYMGSNVESGGRNFYGMRPVAEWEQIKAIRDSKLYKEVLAPLITGGATGFTSAQLVQRALDAVDSKTLKRDDVAPILAQFYQSMALQNNLVHNFAGHGFPAQQSWVVKQEDPVTGAYSSYDLMDKGSLSNFISVQEYLRNRGTVKRVLDSSGLSNIGRTYMDTLEERKRTVRHFVTGRE